MQKSQKKKTKKARYTVACIVRDIYIYMFVDVFNDIYIRKEQAHDAKVILDVKA